MQDCKPARLQGFRKKTAFCFVLSLLIRNFANGIRETSTDMSEERRIKILSMIFATNTD